MQGGWQASRKAALLCRGSFCAGRFCGTCLVVAAAAHTSQGQGICVPAAMWVMEVLGGNGQGRRPAAGAPFAQSSVDSLKGSQQLSG